jgi:hypothetical protein
MNQRALEAGARAIAEHSLAGKHIAMREGANK